MDVYGKKVVAAYYLDCCNEGFFQGFSGIVLAAPAWHGMTYREACESIKDDLRAACYEYDNEQQDVERMIDEIFLSVPNPDDPADFAQYIEPIDEDDEPDVWDGCYLYVGLEMEESEE